MTGPIIKPDITVEIAANATPADMLVLEMSGFAVNKWYDGW